MSEWLSLPTGVTKSIIAGGKGDIPIFQDGGKVLFHFRSLVLKDDGERTVLDDSKKEKEAFELLLGKQFKLDIWETLIKTMRVNEIAEFICDTHHIATYPVVSKSWRDMLKKKHKKHNGHDHEHEGHGHQCGFAALKQGLGYKDLDEYLKEPRPLVFQLELLSVKQPGTYEKDIWSLSIDEKFKSIPKWKEEGNSFYKQKNYDKACEKYSQAIGVLEQLCTREKPGTEEWLEIDHMKIPLLLNFSQCMICKKEYYQAIQHLTTVIEKDENNVKAYYRRAKAYHLIFDFSNAQKDYERAKELDVSLMSTIETELKKIQLDIKNKDNEDKQKFKNAF